MAIRFTCKCGKALEVDHILGGHDVRCPACNATVCAPRSSQTPITSLEETPIEHIRTRIAEGLERDLDTTRVLVIAGGWFLILLAATFVSSWQMEYSSFFMWLFIWLPLLLFLEYATYLTLTSSRFGKLLFLAATLVSLGVSWTYLWLAVESFDLSPKSAAIAFMCSFVNVLFSLGLLWYFGRTFLPAILPPADDSVARPSENPTPPQNGQSP